MEGGPTTGRQYKRLGFSLTPLLTSPCVALVSQFLSRNLRHREARAPSCLHNQFRRAAPCRLQRVSSNTMPGMTSSMTAITACACVALMWGEIVRGFHLATCGRVRASVGGRLRVWATSAQSRPNSVQCWSMNLVDCKPYLTDPSETGRIHLGWDEVGCPAFEQRTGESRIRAPHPLGGPLGVPPLWG